jgi:IS5 family transposase
MEDGYAPTSKEISLLMTIYKLYEQQQYMYENKVHSVENRIVSITQPWIRPIVRGKTKAPVEFGVKFDLSVDDNGLGRIEKISYDAYNESTVLIEAVERFRERTGHYPERLLADQIYRTRDNRNFCKTHGIRLSGPKLGRPSLAMQSAKEKKQEYQDNTDRIEVERSFSLSKRCYGMDLIRTSIIHVNWRYVSRRISFHSARRRNEAYRWLRRLTTMLQMGI